MYTVCCNGTQTRQTGFTILCYSATIYQWMSTVSGIVFQSLIVADILGPRLRRLLLWIFAWQNLDRTFSGDILKKMACSKFWPHVIRESLFSRGPYARAYVPCLMVNPAVPTLLCSGCKSFISGRLKNLVIVSHSDINCHCVHMSIRSVCYLLTVCIWMALK